MLYPPPKKKETHTQNWVSFAVYLTLMTVENAPFSRCDVRNWCLSNQLQMVSMSHCAGNIFDEYKHIFKKTARAS